VAHDHRLTTIRRKSVSSISRAIKEGVWIKRKHEFFGISAARPGQVECRIKPNVEVGRQRTRSFLQRCLSDLFLLR
jgi:hypothetical protein